MLASHNSVGRGQETAKPRRHLDQQGLCGHNGLGDSGRDGGEVLTGEHVYELGLTLGLRKVRTSSYMPPSHNTIFLICNFDIA